MCNSTIIGKPCVPRVVEYCVENKKIQKPLRAAIVSDLHLSDPTPAITLLQKISPNVIFAPGDLMEDLRLEQNVTYHTQGIVLLSAAAQIAPTFYSLGNHEKKPSPAALQAIEHTGAILLDRNCSESFAGLYIGGLDSHVKTGTRKTLPPDLSFVKQFSAYQTDRCKILLCHNPEYYVPYLRAEDIDIVVSGHAHGGQWRLFGRGLYAPGQGLFPRYTRGVYENRLVVSAGLGGMTRVPRINNPAQVVVLHLLPPNCKNHVSRK